MSSAVKLKQWNRAEFRRLVETGILSADDRVQLIEGEIVEMPAMLGPHASAIHRGLRVLARAFGEGYYVRVQVPLALGDRSEPEPDLAVVAGSPDDHVGDHPSTAALVVEVADSSLLPDRQRKASIYAKAHLPEYWILNLVDVWLEVHRDPVELPGALFGFGYRTRSIFRPGESVSPSALPGAEIPVAELFPVAR